MKKYALILIFSIGITFILTFPLGIHLWTNYPYNNDFYLNAWTYWYTSHSFINGSIFKINEFFNSPQLYPFLSTLAHQDYFALPSILLYTPAYLFSNNHIFSVNITIFLSYFLNFISSYYFINKITKDRLASACGALVFSFSPGVIQMGGAYLEYLNRYLVPPFIFLLFKFIKKPGMKNSILLFFVYSLNWFCNIEISIFLILISVIIYLIFTLIKILNKSIFQEYKFTHFKYILVGLVFLPLIVYYFKPYISYAEKENFKRSISEAEYYSAKPLDFFLPSPKNVIFGKLAGTLDSIHFFGLKPPYNLGEHVLFPGYIALVLTVIFSINLLKKRPTKGDLIKHLSFWTLVMSVIISFGPYWRIGQSVIRLPYYYLYQIFPLLEAIRTPTRIMYVWLFFISLMISWQLKSINLQNTKSRTFWYIIIFCLMTTEYLTVMPNEAITPLKINYDLKGKNVLFLPIRNGYDTWKVNDAFYLTAHIYNNFISVNGHTGSESSIEYYDQLTNILKNNIFNSYWFSILKILDVNYIVIDKNALDDPLFNDQKISPELNEYKNMIVYQDHDWVIMDVNKYKNIDENICVDKDFSDMTYTFSGVFDNIEKKIVFEYVLTNNLDCDIAFVGKSRYLKVGYFIEGSEEKGGFIITLPPFLLSKKSYSGNRSVPKKDIKNDFNTSLIINNADQINITIYKP